MLRLLGFITGAALAGLAVLYLLDPPTALRIHGAAQSQAQAALARLRTPAPAASTADSTAPKGAAVAAAPAPREAPDPAPKPEPQVLPDAPGAPSVQDPPEAAAPPQRWQVFWTPFHSQASARGFAQRLSRLTGLPIRVSGRAPGDYRVAFAYQGEQERQAGMQAIEDASGLRLGEGAP